MNVISAEYVKNRAGAANESVKVNGQIFIPIDPANTDYQEIMRRVDAGELTIAEPE